MPQPSTVQVILVVTNHSLTFSNASIVGMMGKGEGGREIKLIVTKSFHRAMCGNIKFPVQLLIVGSLRSPTRQIIVQGSQILYLPLRAM